MLKRLSILLISTLVVACGGGSDASFDNGGAPFLVSVQVTPADAEISVGATEAYSATGIYSDGSEQDVSARASWSSTDTAIATVNADAVVTGIAPGTTQIAATVDGVRGDTGLTVTGVTVTQLQILPPAAEILLNTTQDYRAFAVYSDGSVENVTFSAEWELEGDSGILAAYDPGPMPAADALDDFGTAIGIAVGEDLLVARFAGLESRSTVEVLPAELDSLSITPRDIETPEGTKVSYSATGTYSDGSIADLTKVVDWTSSEPGVATISNAGDSRGLASAIAAGTTSIGASIEGLQDSTSLTVLGDEDEIQRIDVLPAQATVGVTETQQFSAFGITEDGRSFDITDAAEWSVSDESVASIEIDSGLATGLSPGEAPVTAVYESIAGSALLRVETQEITLESITVEPIDSTMLALSNRQFTATGNYSNGSTRDLTNSALWESDNTDVLVVSNLADFGLGLAFAVTPGQTQVSASVENITGSTPVTVIPREGPVAQLVVNPPLAETSIGGQQQYSAELLIEGLPAQDVSDQVSWFSSDNNVATIDASGLASAREGGDTTISALLTNGNLNLSGSAGLRVKPPEVVVEELVIAPAFADVLSGNVAGYQATATFSDGSQLNVSNTCAWSTGNSDIATINSSGLAKGVDPGTTSVIAVYEDNGITVTAEASITVLQKEVVDIVVTPPQASVLVGTSSKFVATAYFPDGSTQDISNVVAWQSSDAAIAQVGSSGLATGLAPGVVDIVASYSSPTGTFSDSGQLTVDAPEVTIEELVVEPPTAEVLQGGSQQYSARVILSNGNSQDVTSSVSWNSSDLSIASVNGQGLATGIAEGNADIVGTLVYNGESFSDSGRLTVSPPTVTIDELIVDPPSASVLVGASTAFSARVLLSNGDSIDVTDQVSWRASDTTVAHVDPTGLATGLAEGISDIDATLLYQGETYTDSGSLTVEPPAVTIEEIRVEPPLASVYIGGTQQFTAEAVLSDASTIDVTPYANWQSADNGVASVDAQGRATGLAAGVTDITATVSYQGETFSGSGELTVNAPIVTPETLIVEPAQSKVLIGGSQAFTARLVFSDSSDQDVTDQVTWSSSSSDIANVDASGLATGLAEGTADITASLNIDGSVFTDSGLLTVEAPAVEVTGLRVEPATAEILIDTQQQYMAFAELSNGTDIDVSNDVSWNSSDKAIAHVSASGLATGISEGVVDITASLVYEGDTFTDSGQLTVNAPEITIDELIVEPAVAEVLVGNTQQYSARVVLSNGTEQDVTGDVSWTSGDSAIASVNSLGLATGLAEGLTAITATLVYDGATYTDSGDLTVTPPAVTIDELVVDPVSATVLIDGTQQFTARVLLSNGDSQDVTGDVSWTVSDDVVAHVDAAGLATGLAEGVSEVIASLVFEGVTYTDSGSLTVEPPAITIDEIRVLPATATVFVGGKQQYTAEAVLSNNETVDVTSDASWTSDNSGVATVDSTGRATGVAEGSAGIVATIVYQGETYSGEASLTVNPPLITPEGLVVEPAQQTVLVGATQQFTARLIFSDASSQDVTDQAAWSSSNGAIASVDTAGLATGLAEGSADISASLNIDGAVFSDSGQLTVEEPAAVVTGLRVEPAAAEVLIDNAQQFRAFAELSDNTETEVTRDVTWSSGDSAIAHVSVLGRATGVAEGSTGITATLVNSDGNFADTAQLTVKPAPVTVTELVVAPENAAILPNQTQQYSATALLSDNTSTDVTDSVSWTSGTPIVAQIDSAGLATGLTAGSTSIKAALSYGDGLSVEDSVTLTVNPIELISITVTPADASVPLGRQVQYVAQGTYNDNSTADITADVSWSSSNTAVAAIDFTGLAITATVGSSTISAELDGVTGITTLTVTDKVADDLQIFPSEIDDPIGTSGQMIAEVHYSDLSKDDVTALATWSSADTAIALVGDSGFLKGRYSLEAEGSTEISASYEGLSDTIPVNVTPPSLVLIQVSPGSAEEPAGVELQFTATGLYSNGESADLTDDVLWSSSDDATATIDTSGLANALAPGVATISAVQDGVTGKAILTVTEAQIVSLQVTPPDSEGSAGTTEQLNATAIFSDGNQRVVTDEAEWSSNNEVVATVGNAAGQTRTATKGLVSLLSPGSATISASFDGLIDDAQVSVNEPVVVDLFVEPYGETYPEGLVVEFTAIATYDNGSSEEVTEDAVWHSLNGDVIQAVPGQPGQFQTVTPGTTDVTATFAEIVEDAPVTVVPTQVVQLQIEPGSVTAPAGSLIQLEATAFYDNQTSEPVTDQSVWLSADRDVASIFPFGKRAGLMRLEAEGTTTVSAQFSGLTQSITVTVTPATLVEILVQPPNASVPNGLQQQYEAVGIFSDGSSTRLEAAQWSSSSPAIAEIDATGVAYTRAVGVTTIEAAADGITGNTSLTVTEATVVSMEINPAANVGPAGTESGIEAIALLSDNSSLDVTGEVTWGSSSGFIATVTYSATDNLATLSYNNAGIAEINATLGSGDDAIVAVASAETTAAVLESIVLNPNPVDMPAGTIALVVATGLYSDGSSAPLNIPADWVVLDPNVATVTQFGLLVGISQGSTTITATVGDISGSTTVNVLSAVLQSIQITPADVAEPVGNSLGLTATGYYSDNSSQDITPLVAWRSNNQAIATVTTGGSDAGLLKLEGVGTTQISAALNGITDTIEVEGVPAVLETIQVIPTLSLLPVGLTEQFTARGQFSDGSYSDVSNDVTWSSTKPENLQMDQSGVGTALAVGLAGVRASQGDITGLAEVVITPATLVDLQVTPAGLVEPAGTSGRFTATGTYSNGQQKDLTADSTWTSSDTQVALVTNQPLPGFAFLRVEGEANITATTGGISDTVTVTVTSAVLEEIRVSPAVTSVGEGIEVQYSAEGVFSDGTVTPIDGDVSWQSSNTTIATINSDGVADTVGTGGVTITATLDDIAGSAILTVTEATIASLDIKPAIPQTLLVGQIQQYEAIATYTNGDTADLTDQAVWLVNPPNIAATQSTPGEILAVEVGSGEVTAQFDEELFGRASGRSTISDSVGLTVDAPGVVAVEINTFRENGQAVEIPAGRSESWQAFAIFSDGSFTEITDTASWASSNNSTATVLQGDVNAIASGTTDISIVYRTQGTNARAGFGNNEFTDTVALTVTNAELVSIEVNPDTATVAPGQTADYNAIGIYSDGGSQNVTADASWDTGNSGVAVIDAVGTQVSVLGIAAGTTSVSASLDGISDEAEIVVNNDLPTSLVINDAIPLSVGSTWIYTATATFADGSSRDVTDSSAWTSSDTDVAVIGNENSGNSQKGLAETLAEGTTTITASYEGLTATSLLEVTAACEASSPNGKPDTVFITPDSPELDEVGDTVQLQAIGVYLAGCQQGLTVDPQTNWRVTGQGGSNRIIEVNNTGLVTGLQCGTGTVEANHRGVMAQTTVTVCP